MGQRIVGLEFSTDTIRYVQLNTALFGKKTVEKVGSVSISGCIDATGKISDSVLLADQLRKLWKSEGLRTKKVALGIGGAEVFVREFSVPMLSDKELASALPALAEPELPMPTSELVLDFYPGRLVEVEGKSSVSGLLVAALRNSVESITSAVQSAGLIPDSLDLIPFAVSRQISFDFEDESVVAVVHSSHGTMNITVHKGKVPMFVRIVPIPTVFRTPEAPTETSKVESESTAEKEVSDPFSYLGSQDSDSEFVRVTQREIQETITFFNANHRSEQIERLVIASEEMAEQDWTGKASSVFSIPIQHFNPIVLPSESKKATDRTPLAIDSQMLVPYSLAMGREGD